MYICICIYIYIYIYVYIYIYIYIHTHTHMSCRRGGGSEKADPRADRLQLTQKWPSSDFTIGPPFSDLPCGGR